MLKVLLERLKQGHRTFDFPRQEPTLPDRFRGVPTVDVSRCPQDCRACAEACPTQAITFGAAKKKKQADQGPQIDLGRCVFCTECVEACPVGALHHSQDYRLAARSRQDLVVSCERTLQLAQALDERARGLFGHSLKLRQVSAGGCNACEADTNVLNTLVYDLGRFGIQFVASPRHADGLLITGPVPQNMRLAVKKTYDAVPAPKIVVALGACAISGGVYSGHGEVSDGAEGLVPVDLYIPGCPPHPYTILDGLLRLLGRREEKR
jgi:Ni,Fe-hydrogenase III small subunit/Pyruvate/2-oxoacid:ferredoxin oxidoreductase delta subunit